MCDFDKLMLLLEGKLPLDEGLELFDHLDACEVCFEEVYRIWKNHRRRFRGLGRSFPCDSDPVDSDDERAS